VTAEFHETSRSGRGKNLMIQENPRRPHLPGDDVTVITGLPPTARLFKLPFELNALLNVLQEKAVLDQLRQRLPDYKRTELPLALPEAAVLMPLIDDPEPRLILTVLQHHAYPCR
jgi:hypothetical protein